MSISFSDLFSSFDDQKLGELLNKTKDVAEEVSKKSAERIELSRKRVELFDAKAKLSRMYERFGKIQYNGYIGEEISQAEIDDIANQIAELKEKIEIYSEEIENAKDAFNESMAYVAKRTKEAFTPEKEEVEAEASVAEE